MDLFGRIMAQRLNQATTLRPVLAPHFAPRLLPLADGGEARGAADDGWPGEVHEQPLVPVVGARLSASARAPDRPDAGAEARSSRTAASDDERWSTSHGPTPSVRPATPVWRADAAPPQPPTRTDARAGAAPPTEALTRSSMLAARGVASTRPVARVPAGPPSTPAWPRPDAPTPALPLAPARAAMLGPLPPPSRSDPAPVVHVHIDRIDLRAPPAATTAPAAPRATRPAPARSLGDYLRQRGGR